MNKNFTQGFLLLFAVIFFSGVAIRSQAQTFRTVEVGNFYTSLTCDASNNIYVSRYNPGPDRYEVVRYKKGTGTPVVILSGLLHGTTTPDYPLGLVVASNGDVYVASTQDNKVFKLTYNSTTDTYAASTFISGKLNCALAIDASDNIYTNEKVDASHYAVVRYPAGSSTGTRLYSNIAYGSGFNYPTGLAVASNGDIYFTDGFKNPTTGSVHKVTAASGYATVSTISSDKNATALAMDPAGNLYCSELNGTTYVLDKYTNATGVSTNLRNLASNLDGFYPWGIVALSDGDIYFATGNPTDNDDIVELIAAPTTQSTNVSFSNVMGASLTATWTKGSGAARAVFIKNATSGSPAPVNNTTYTANANYGSGTQIGAAGWFSVYDGTGTSVNITGLTSGASYQVMSVEYNGAPGNQNYLTATGTNNPNTVLSVPLPVTWLDFDVTSEDGVCTWSWKLGLEQNVGYYVPQYSMDGIHFTDAGKITTVDSSHSYRYSAALSLEGNVFFRVLEADLDGHSMYSWTRSLRSAASQPLSLYPNPAVSEVSIQWPYADATSVQIVILNSAGKIVRQQQDALSSPIKISLSGLTPGTYFIYGRDDRTHVTKAQPVFKVAK